MIHRRAFLQASGTGFLGATALCNVGVSSHAPQKHGRELAITTALGVSSGGYSDTMYQLLCRIETACKGSLKFRVTEAATSGNGNLNLSTQDGHLGLLSGNFETPQGSELPTDFSERRTGPQLSILPELFQVKFLIAGVTGPSLGLWSKMPISDIDELRSVPVYARGAAGLALETLGARRVAYSAKPARDLFSGSLYAADCGDGAECVASGVARIARFCATGVSQEHQAISLTFSKRCWDTLSTEEKEVISFFTRDNVRQSMLRQQAETDAYRAAFTAAHNTTFYSMPQPLYQKFEHARKDITATIETRFGITRYL